MPFVASDNKGWTIFEDHQRPNSGMDWENLQRKGVVVVSHNTYDRPKAERIAGILNAIEAVSSSPIAAHSLLKDLFEEMLR